MWVMRVWGGDGGLRPWHYIYEVRSGRFEGNPNSTTPAAGISPARTSIYDKYSGSIKITTYMDPMSHSKASLGTNW